MKNMGYTNKNRQGNERPVYRERDRLTREERRLLFWTAAFLLLAALTFALDRRSRALDVRLEAAKAQMEQIRAESGKLRAKMQEYGFPDETAPDADSAAPERAFAGTYTITAYCPCERCCGQWSNPEEPRTASGTIAAAGRTVGADWDMLPAGTVIEIEGVGERVVEDRPAGWIVEKYGGRILDLYCESHEEALAFGKKEAKIWILNG